MLNPPPKQLPPQVQPYSKSIPDIQAILPLPALEDSLHPSSLLMGSTLFPDYFPPWPHGHCTHPSQLTREEVLLDVLDALLPFPTSLGSSVCAAAGQHPTTVVALAPFLNRGCELCCSSGIRAKPRGTKSYRSRQVNLQCRKQGKGSSRTPGSLSGGHRSQSREMIRVPGHTKDVTGSRIK